MVSKFKKKKKFSYLIFFFNSYLGILGVYAVNPTLIFFFLKNSLVAS